MTKRLIIQKIIETLQSEMETYVRAAKLSHAEATAEENRAENKYDTRGLEASYLATGQANKIVEIEESIAAFDALLERKFPEDGGVDVGTLVELKQNGQREHYFLGPTAGGTEITYGKYEVLIITSQSPLGSQLLTRKRGDQLEILLAGAKQSVEVVNVQ